MNIIEMIQKNDMLKLVLILVAIYFFMQYYNKETLENVSANVSGTTLMHVPEPASIVNVEQQQIDKIVAGTPTLTTTDLLPKYDDASDFAKQNPVSKVLQEQNFLQSGYHIGINTVIQSNKIPYLDLRSAPPIPKQEVGPFNNSSFLEPMGAKRRFFELGS